MYMELNIETNESKKKKTANNLITTMFNNLSKNESEFLKIKERMRAILGDLMFDEFELKDPDLFRIG